MRLPANSVRSGGIARGIGIVEVVANLPDVAVHVIEAPGVGLLGGDGVGVAAAVGLGPGVIALLTGLSPKL